MRIPTFLKCELECEGREKREKGSMSKIFVIVIIKTYIPVRIIFSKIYCNLTGGF